MLIKRIILKNFRNFKNVDVTFSTDEDKKFTIILGENTNGKTTFVRAFVWCLYRINLFDDKNVLNKEIATSMKPNESTKVSVELELEHQNYKYKITTKQEFRCSSLGKITSSAAYTSIVKSSDYEAVIVPPSDVNDEIESILRSELSNYFFFEGENSIDNATQKKNLKDAVINILGLNKVEKFRDYFNPNRKNTIMSSLQDELQVADIDQYNRLNDSLEEKREKKLEVEKEISDCEDQIKALENQKRVKQAELDANLDIKDLQEEKRKINKYLDENYDSKKDNFNRLIGAINSGDAFLKVLFAKSYIKFNFNNIKNESSFQSDNSYRFINEKAVDDLIALGRCICGAEIKEGNDAYKHLILAKEHMEPKDYGKHISDFDSAEQSNVFNAQSTIETIKSLNGKILDKIEEIDDEEKRIQSINKKILGRVDCGQVQNDLIKIERDIATQTTMKQVREQKTLPELDEDIKNINNQISSCSEKNKENEFIKLCMEYAQQIYDTSIRKITKSEISIRSRLEELVSEIFASMYHGARKIFIDEKFNVHAMAMVNGEFKELDLTGGLQTVINYAFVAGLMRLAKENMLNHDENDILEDEEIDSIYPLVMDAPFSKTDDEHIENICKALPLYCNQIIMFVMQKDFEKADRVISDQIGKKYIITKISETEGKVEPDKDWEDR